MVASQVSLISGLLVLGFASGAIPTLNHDQSKDNSVTEAPWIPATQPRDFSYNIQDRIQGASQFRQETWKNGTMSGLYAIPLGDGLWQMVTYIVDDKGYRIVSTKQVPEAEILDGAAHADSDTAGMNRDGIFQAAMDHIVQSAKTHREVQLPTAYGQNAESLANAVPSVTIEGQPGAAGPIDPALLKHLQVSASLAGLQGPQLQQFVSAVNRANLNATQISELQRAIMEHPPSAEDLSVVARVLQHDLTGTLKSTLTARGAPDSLNKTARAVEDGLRTLYTSQRLCGYVPAVSNKWGDGVAAPGQFPWNAAVYTASNNFLCQGTLLSASHVIAPASCIMQYKKDNMPLKVVLNAWDLPAGSSQDNYLPPLEIFAKSAVVHSQYKENEVTQNNNIGLIVLSNNVDFERYPSIFPVCIIGTDLLANVMNTNNGPCIVTGWSASSSAAGIPSSEKLCYGDVNVTNTGCPSTTSSCATARACSASAGSPILCQGSTPNRYFLRSIITDQPTCDPSSPTSVVPVVSIAENFPFFMQYLTLNPLGAFTAPAPAPAAATPATGGLLPGLDLGALLPGLGL